VGPIDVERAYVELAKPVLDALSTGMPMAEGELFKHLDASNIMQFRTAIEEMKARGLVKIVEFNQPFNEPIYGQGPVPPGPDRSPCRTSRNTGRTALFSCRS
jgi:hypothetical protein